MRSTKQIFPACTAIIGFAVAWVIKPQSKTAHLADATSEQRATAKKTSSSDPTRKNPNSANHPNKTYLEDVSDLPPEYIEAQKTRDDELRNGLMQRDQGFVRRMAELLSLSDDQQNQLLELLIAKRQSISIFSTPGITPSQILEYAEKSETAYHGALSNLLSSSQITQYNQYIKQQSENRSVAKAKTDFADLLQKIDLNPEQHAAAESALQQIALRDQSSTRKSHIFYEFYDTLGYGLAANQIAHSSANTTKIANATDQAAVFSEVAHARQKESAEKLESLRSILTPAQLEQYKIAIEATDRAYYKTMSQYLERRSIDPQNYNPNVEN